MDGKGWRIIDMGKDIDRNITRQLWERLKNSFSKNDVIPVANGGTGKKSLSAAYPVMVTDKNVKTVGKYSITMHTGFTLADDSNLSITVNEKSMFIEGRLHVLRTSGITTEEFCSFSLSTGGYNIEKIKIAPWVTTMSIKDNIVTLSAYFGDNNEYDYNINAFIPFI